MTNSNCLECIMCPQCGNDVVIYIEARTLTLVTDEGARAFGDMDWDGDSYAECPECQYRGALSEFRIDPVIEISTSTNKEE